MVEVETIRNGSRMQYYAEQVSFARIRQLFECCFDVAFCPQEIAIYFQMPSVMFVPPRCPSNVCNPVPVTVIWLKNCCLACYKNTTECQDSGFLVCHCYDSCDIAEHVSQFVCRRYTSLIYWWISKGTSIYSSYRLWYFYRNNLTSVVLCSLWEVEFANNWVF